MIWNPEYETMERASLHELQLRRLQTTVAWVYERVPYYRDQLEALGTKPRDIKTLEDVRKLPFTDKSALRDTYPFGMFALPLEEIVRVHSSSGTTGKPIVVGYSKGDINTWSELTARVAAAAGVHRGDRVQMAFLYSMFTGGWGMHYGIERIGASVVPAGSGNTERHIMMMQDFGTTVLVSTPSYALYMAEVGEQMGVDFQKLPLRLGLFGGEPMSDRAKAEIEARLAITATDNYGLTELIGPGVAGECECGCGLHIAEDHFLLEVVDPVSGDPDLIVVDRKHNMDDIEVRLEVAEEVFSDIMADMLAFTNDVGSRLQSVIGLRAKITLVEPGTIERTAGKAKRVLDLREES